MDLQLPELPENFSRVGCGLAGIATAVFIVIRLASRPSKLDAIPTVGSSGWFGSWWAGLKYLTNAADVIQEGYKKHKSAPFKVATPYCWTVVLSNREHVEEMRKAPDDVLSFSDATSDLMQVEYTMGSEIHHNPYHISILRAQLTRNLDVLYPEIQNEVIAAFENVLDLQGNEWKSISVLSSMRRVVCRTIHRMIVGLPLCRDPDWIDLNNRYTIDVALTAFIIRLFPKLLGPIVTWFPTVINQDQQRGRKLLGPMIERRRKHLDEYGNEWADKPNDFLSWSMEEVQGSESTVNSLTRRMLVINFAANSSVSNSFANVLFYLGANPQYIQPLREEVDRVIEREGWSKAAVSKMRRVDSFLRECQRMEGGGPLLIMRKAKRDFTFSDGTFIPEGTMIGVAARCLHNDEKYYKNPDVFEPFRFSEMQETGGEGRYQFVSTSNEYLAFGHDKHACPGRFFAGIVMKTMLAHVVTTYNIKLEDGMTHPRRLHFGGAVIPNPRVKILFKMRVD